MKCYICNESNFIKKIDEYKLLTEEDKNTFEISGIYKCSSCELGFANPMPDRNKLNNFYKNVYRSPNRPPYFNSLKIEDIKSLYLEDKNLNYLLYLTTFIEFTKIKNILDFGSGFGDLGFALKKNFENINLNSIEHDKFCSEILNERGYKNHLSLDDIPEKSLDLIISLHSLEHLDSLEIFESFRKKLDNNGHIFFEVPNSSKEYFAGRAFDSPHLFFFTKKSFEKICAKFGFEIVNFSNSSYSYKMDNTFQSDAQKKYLRDKKSFLSKSSLKKFIPNYLISLRRYLIKGKKIDNPERMMWFTNNTGKNCYIRGILRKK